MKGRCRRSCLSGKICLFSSFIIAFITLLAVLHLQLLPSWTHAYNDDCYLSPGNKRDLIYLIKGLADAFHRHNITYWLDYGTLLGAVRYHSVIPWDGDGDISIIHPGDNYDASPWSAFLAEKGIEANMMIASYGNMKCDIMRWKRYYPKDIMKLKQSYLFKYYPPTSQDSFIVKLSHKLESFPEEWIEPRHALDLDGSKVHVPFKWKELLAKRYPASFKFQVPYKWKCWTPRWMT